MEVAFCLTYCCLCTEALCVLSGHN